jgi:hypothetical protein
MSRWEVYKNEVESGHLRWGSTHTEAFSRRMLAWIEGSDGDFHLLEGAHSSSVAVTKVAAVVLILANLFNTTNGRAIAVMPRSYHAL